MTFTIDDNLRDVLEDISTSKMSALFAGTFLKNVHEAYTIPDGRFAAMRLGMGSAERHLLETYRSELSHLLVDSFLGFYQDSANLEDHVQVAGGGKVRGVSPERIRYVRDSASRSAFVPGATHWLRILLEGGPIRDVGWLGEMLGVAVRLKDSPRARIYMGLCHLVRNDSAGCFRALAPVLSHSAGEMFLGARSVASDALERAGRWADANSVSAEIVVAGASQGLIEYAQREYVNLVVRGALMGFRRLPDAVESAAREFRLPSTPYLGQALTQTCAQMGLDEPARDELYCGAFELTGYETHGYSGDER